jgi:outer membrane protein
MEQASHMAKKMYRRRAALLAAAALLLPSPGFAETLQGALSKAYENNPSLTAARAGQRAIDENVPILQADGLPSASLASEYDEFLKERGPVGTDRRLFANTRISVPLYRGGTVRNSVRAAKERVEAGQADLRSFEASIFSQVVAAYMNVIRDQAIVALNRNNVARLATNLEAARDRFEIGDLTRTDVAQSEARLALSASQLSGVEANLIRSREDYIRLVGDAPVDLESPPMLPGLPGSDEDAVAIALGNNPDLEAAGRDVAASRYDISAAKGSRMPQLSATADGTYNDYLGTVPGGVIANSSTSATAGLSLTIPLFQGGRPAARVRQAQARSSQAIESMVATERSVISQTRASYASWTASQQVIAATKQAVAANALSLEGVRAENSVGTRSILDILNAEQELLDTQVRLVSAERDAYVAAFTLLAAMGKAEARDLGLDGGALYDPATNYERVRNQIWDWSDDPAPQQQATSTRGVPAADAAAPDMAGP